MSTKVEMREHNRIKLRENYNTLDSIKREIIKRVEQEYTEEIKALQEENRTFQDEEAKFKKEAKEFLSSVHSKTELKVRVQVGEGSKVINEYVGTLQRAFAKYDTYFNFIDPNYLQGKPFTIGFSCLLSIEKTYPDTLQEGDWFTGTYEQYLKCFELVGVTLPEYTSYRATSFGFLSVLKSWSWASKRPVFLGFDKKLTELTPEEFIRRAENTYTKKTD